MVGYSFICSVAETVAVPGGRGKPRGGLGSIN